MKTKKHRLASELLAELGDDAHIPLYQLLYFEPGRSSLVSKEEAELAEAIARARKIRVDAMELVSGPREWPRIYQITISCVQELTLPDVQRIITLGQAVAAAQDANE